MSRVMQDEFFAQARQRIRSRLRRLEAWLAVYVAALGLSRLVVLVFFVAVASLALDWMFRLDAVQRTVLLVTAMAAVGWGLWRWLVRVFWLWPEHRQLALAVEAAEPRLGRRLITALELLGAGSPADGASLALIRAAVEQGLGVLPELDVHAAINRRFIRRTWRWMIAGVLVAGLCGVVWVLPVSAETAWLWLRRNVFLSAEPWPRRTQLVPLGLVNGGLKAVYGEDWKLEVQVHGRVPRRIELQYRPADGSGRIQSQNLVQVEPRLWQMRLSRVLQPMEFRLIGGDDCTDWHRLYLLHRPAIRSLRLTLRPPTYTALPTQELAAGQSVYLVPAGSSLELGLEATKPLRSASVQRGPELVMRLEPRGGGPASDCFAGKLGAGQLVSGLYSVQMEDTDALEPRPPVQFSVQVRPDQPPSVRAMISGSWGMCTPRAVLDLQIAAEDDYALTALDLLFRRTGSGDETALFERQDISASIRAIAGAEAGLPVSLPQRRLRGGFPLAMEELDCRPGQDLVLVVQGHDNDALNGPKSGRSSPILLRVVSEQEFRGELQRRQQELRMELERLVRDQENLETEGRVLSVEVSGVVEAVAERLLALERRQRILVRRAQSLAGQLQGLVDQAVANRLDDLGGPMTRHLLEKVVRPLKGIAEQPMSRAAVLLEQVRLQSLESGRIQADLAEVTSQQQLAARQLRQTLEQIRSWAGLQEAMGLLQEILQVQRQVQHLTVQQLHRRLERLLTPGP